MFDSFSGRSFRSWNILDAQVLWTYRSCLSVTQRHFNQSGSSFRGSIRAWVHRTAARKLNQRQSKSCVHDPELTRRMQLLTTWSSRLYLPVESRLCGQNLAIIIDLRRLNDISVCSIKFRSIPWSLYRSLWTNSLKFVPFGFICKHDVLSAEFEGWKLLLRAGFSWSFVQGEHVIRIELLILHH